MFNRHRLTEVFIYLFPLIFGGIVLFFTRNKLVFCFFLLLVFWPIIKMKFLKRLLKKIDIKHSSFWYDGFLFIGSPVLREIRKYAAYSKSLDIIYNYFGDFGISPKCIPENWWENLSRWQLVNGLIKRWTEFWLTMPIAQDVRERLKIVSEMVYETIRNSSKKEFKILSLAGGTNQDVLMAVKRIQEDCPRKKVTLVSVEPDGLFGIKRARELQKIFKLDPSRFTYKEVRKRVSLDSSPGQTISDLVDNFEEFDLILCIGLGDYVFGKHNLEKFLKTLDNGRATIITSNVSGNYIERLFLHILIEWPWMQYLSKKRFYKITKKAIGKNQVKIFPTTNGVFNVAKCSPFGELFF